MRMGQRSAAALLALALAFAASDAPATAAKAPKLGRAAELQAVVDCRAIKDRDARLDCYDAAAAKLDQAEASGQVVVVDRARAREVRKEVFGLQLPSLDIFSVAAGKGASLAKEDQIDQLEGVVKRAWRDPDGKWVMELDSGAVWRQIEPNDLTFDPHQGSKVVIRKASLGSFMMKVDGQPAFKAHRDR